MSFPTTPGEPFRRGVPARDDDEAGDASIASSTTTGLAATPALPVAASSAAAEASGTAALAAGFARRVERWSRSRGATASSARLAARVAAAVATATADGHVCLDLDEALRGSDAPASASNAAEARAALLASGVVDPHDAAAHAPLVIDAANRVYLHRYFDYERRLAQRLVAASDEDAPPTSAGTIARLRALFAPNAAGLGGAADWQQIAAALALRRRLVVISGGPGTGKTTTVVNLLACLLAENPEARIALAAPTGKAAARMTEAIRERAAHLEPALRERLPTEASTVHRLLGVTGGGPGAARGGSASGGFRHHAGRPLAIDALVVDEASMLDLALATRLLEAVPPGARIVLLGDKDQLSAVESGSVFAELSVDPSLSAPMRAALAADVGLPVEQLQPPAATRAGSLPDAAVWFRRNFRFAPDSGIGRLAGAINGSDAEAEAAAALLAGAAAPAGDGELRWIDDAEAAPSAATLAAVERGFEACFDAVRRDPLDPRSIFDAFGRFRVLCAVREGPRGVLAINARLSALARRRQAATLDSPWFVGRPVIVTRNDYLLKLYNGDIGMVLPDANGELSVVFPEPGGGWRRVPPLRLPAHQDAYAMTVHKSQGSEFDEVLLLLPRRAGRVLSRELLYTAVTRARRHATIAASAAVVEAAVRSPTHRRSGLLDRLREAQAAHPGPGSGPARPALSSPGTTGATTPPGRGARSRS